MRTIFVLLSRRVWGPATPSVSFPKPLVAAIPETFNKRGRAVERFGGRLRISSHNPTYLSLPAGGSESMYRHFGVIALVACLCLVTGAAFATDLTQPAATP